jgi:hypothetical protein
MDFLYKIESFDDATDKEEVLMATVKQLYKTGVLTKKWRNNINKLDQHLSNYLMLQSADAPIILKYFISKADWTNFTTLCVATFIYCDFAIFYELINASCPFNHDIIPKKYLIGKLFKYNKTNLPSLILKLQYIIKITTGIRNIINGYLLIYSDVVSITYADLFLHKEPDWFFAKERHTNIIKPKKAPQFIAI